MYNEIAKARGENFLARYGGKISLEWFIPKVLQVLKEFFKALGPRLENVVEEKMATEFVLKDVMATDFGTNTIVEIYKKLYAEYKKLHDDFGRG